MVYPVKRYEDIQGWIPETDVDGVNVKDSFVSDCENIDFENAFMKNAVKPVVVAHPSSVDTYITGGYEILALQYFNHEKRGDVFFYVLYKQSSGHLIKFIVKDDTSVYELNPDEQNSNITFTNKPSNIVFSLAENQLKVNLNTVLNYSSLNKLVMGNFTLIYLKKRSYIDTIIDRAEGWYLFPRWLGWTYDEDLTYQWAEGDVEDFEDGTYFYSVTFPTASTLVKPFTNDGTYFNDGAQSVQGAPSAGTLWAVAGGTQSSPYYSFSMIPANPKVCTFWARTDIGKSAFVGVWVIVSGLAALQEEIEIATEGTWQKFSIEARIVGATSFDIRQRPNSITGWDVDPFRNPVSLPDEFSFNRVNIDTLSWAETSEELDTTVVAKYVDGQRAALQNGYLSSFTLSIDIKEIDWRVVAYEIYKVPTGGGVQTLHASVDVDGKDWTADAGIISKTISKKETTTSLIFNYGLKGDVRVLTVDEDTNVIGDTIFSEAYHKARSYYVKGDMRVYHSHISGTGRGQADSFPFSIENQYGFFETFKSEKNYTVSVTSQDELAIGTRRKAYVYFIQGGRGVILRILKAINGGQSVIGSKAMLSDLEGQPEATVLAWFNEEGLYLSPGGRREPRDVVKATHKNYWLARANKDKAVLFFNKAKKEIWIAFPNREVMIYELDFNKWKKYKYDFAIINFIGNVDNDLYVLGDDKKMYKIDFSGGVGSTLTGYIVTHYSSNTLVVDRYPMPAPEHELKVLQELYVAWNKRSSGVFEYTIIADGNTYLPIKMFPNNFTDLVLAPQLLVYGKIKIKLKIPAVGAWVRELGYTYSVPDRAPGQIVQPNKTGIGMNTGLQLGVHQ